LGEPAGKSPEDVSFRAYFLMRERAASSRLPAAS